MTMVPPVDVPALDEIGSRLRRPECVLCTSDGSILVPDWDGGVTRIDADGSQLDIRASHSSIALKPNGLALLPDRSILLANLGDEGGVWRLAENGSVAPFLLDIDGDPVPPANFVLPDRKGRIWITVSTRMRPRHLAWRGDVADGFIVVVSDGKARIVADGLGYTNEVQLHPSGDWLYVNETFARRLSRMRINADASLGARETIAEFGAGTFPDGLCFDEDLGIWIVSIVSNRVIRIGPDGSQHTVIEDLDPTHLARVEDAYATANMKRHHLDSVVSTRLRSISSIAFGGAARRRCYLGCLLGDRLMSFESPVAGVKPVHWDWCLTRKR